jgi:hypothetical protein
MAKNSLFIASGYGSAQFFVAHLGYGVETVYQQAESSTERTVYFRNVVDDNFVVTIDFASWEDYTAGANWFETYMRLAGDPDSNAVSPMIVSVPLRGFLRVGVPEQGISFGDVVGQIVRTMTISFTGTADYSNTSSSSGGYALPSSGTIPTNSYGGSTGITPEKIVANLKAGNGRATSSLAIAQSVATVIPTSLIPGASVDSQLYDSPLLTAGAPGTTPIGVTP